MKRDVCYESHILCFAEARMVMGEMEVVVELFGGRAGGARECLETIA
jgi:hypothetical protein